MAIALWWPAITDGERSITYTHHHSQSRTQDNAVDLESKKSIFLAWEYTCLQGCPEQQGVTSIFYHLGIPLLDYFIASRLIIVAWHKTVFFFISNLLNSIDRRWKLFASLHSSYSRLLIGLCNPQYQLLRVQWLN